MTFLIGFLMGSGIATIFIAALQDDIKGRRTDEGIWFGKWRLFFSNEVPLGQVWMRRETRDQMIVENVITLTKGVTEVRTDDAGRVG